METFKFDFNKSSIVIGKLLHIGGMLEREGTRLLAPLGLNQQQYSVLFEISWEKKVKQKDIRNRLVLERAHVSKIVKKLLDMGLIAETLSDDDKRSAWISITKKGQKTIDKSLNIFKEWNKTWQREFSPAELDVLIKSLGQFQSVLIEKLT